MSAGDCEQDLPPKNLSFLFPNPQIEFFKVYTIKTIALAIESWSSALFKICSISTSNQLIGPWFKHYSLSLSLSFSLSLSLSLISKILNFLYFNYFNSIITRRDCNVSGAGARARKRERERKRERKQTDRQRERERERERERVIERD